MAMYTRVVLYCKPDIFELDNLSCFHLPDLLSKDPLKSQTYCKTFLFLSEQEFRANLVILLQATLYAAAQSI